MRLAILSVVSVTAMLLLSSCSVSSVSQESVNLLNAPSGPAGYVNPFIGTGSGGSVVGDIQDFPGADVPFGMMQWSPDTVDPNPLQPSVGGYLYASHTITGFSLNHLSGAGCMQYGNFSFMPFGGSLESSPASNPSSYYASFAPREERAFPGYYRVILHNHMSVRLAVGKRSGVGEFGFSKGERATILLNTSASETPVSASGVEITGKDTISGWVTSGHFCSADNSYTAYFVAKFNRNFKSFGTWNATSLDKGSRSYSNSNGDPTGAYVSFGSCKGNCVVSVDVALSYTGPSGALSNLAHAHDDWNMAKVVHRAVNSWNAILSRIQVSGGTRTEETTFYTALYHSLLFPSLFSDTNGEYIGFNGKLYTAHKYPQYTNFSEWDIYRSEIPLLSLIAPHQVDGMVTSLIRDAEQGGWLPKWPVANQYTGVMGGDSSDLVIADAYAMGARSFNTAQALKYMVKGATVSGIGPDGYVERPGLAGYIQLGWVPDSSSLSKESSSVSEDGASITLEYATDDFGIYTLASSLGDSSIANQFLARSNNWSNLIDPADHMIVPRAANGSFPPDWPAGSLTLPNALATIHIQGVGQSGFQEGDSTQYTWAVPQNIAGLVKAIGGRSVAQGRLATFFKHLNAGPTAPYDWAGNEPTLEVPWIGDYVGMPWLTQKVTREIVNRFYTDTPGGEPGNDDLGAMSSWAVWAMVGMYPETPGTSTLVLGSPLFSKVLFKLPDGRSIQISANGAAKNHPYVKSLNLNGHEYNKTFLPSNVIDTGAKLSFSLTSRPDTSWGSALSSAPPSY